MRRGQVGLEFIVGRQRDLRAAFSIGIERFAEAPPGLGAAVVEGVRVASVNSAAPLNEVAGTLLSFRRCVSAAVSAAGIDETGQRFLRWRIARAAMADPSAVSDPRRVDRR